MIPTTPTVATRVQRITATSGGASFCCRSPLTSWPPPLQQYRGRQAGFTVIEMVVVLAIVGILARIALPALMNGVRDSSISATTNQLVVSLNYARNQALIQHTTVSLCQATAPSIANPNCTSNATKGYAGGWTIYAASCATAPTSANILKVFIPDSNLAITAKGTSSTTPSVQTCVSFSPMGMLSGAAVGTVLSAPNNPGIVLCDDRAWANGGQYARVISMSGQGRIANALGSQQNNINSQITSCSP